MKKFLSLVLALFIVLSCFSVLFVSASAETVAVNDYPVIVVSGRLKNQIFVDQNGNQVNPTEVNVELITEACKECLPSLSLALITGNYQPWIDKVMEIVTPIYEGMLPDKNGDITNGTYSSNIQLSSRGKGIGGYFGFAESFYYDWREDPYVSAYYLYLDVQAVKEKYNAEKVSIVGRCYGDNVLAAYLDKYGAEDIDTVVFSVGSQNGADAATCGFTGNLVLNANYIQNYTDISAIFGDPVIDELLNSTLNFLNAFYGLDSLSQASKIFLDKLYPIIAPHFLRASYGRFASIWAMVAPEAYEQAKKLVFTGYEDEYKGLIAKIDKYKAYQSNLVENLKNLQEEQGLNIAVLAKYNYVLAPVLGTANLQSDDTIALKNASFGATVADYGKTLSADYLASVDKKDEKYISSDKIIDASTCAFRDRTWFIKDSPHSLITHELVELLLTICHSGKDFTVESDENYPQFIKCTVAVDSNHCTLVPLEDKPAKEKGILEKIEDFLAKFLRAFTAFFDWVQMKLAKN